MLEKKNAVKPSISVLLAALNEEEGIGLTLAELEKYLCGAQFIVVDGKSWDGTVHMAKSLGAEVVCQNGKGKGDAIGCALRYMDNDCEYVTLIDADFTYPAEFIPRMIRILDDNPHVGMVCGNRFGANDNSCYIDNILHLGNRVLAFIHNLFNGVTLRDPLTGLRVVRSELVRKWHPKSSSFDIEVELNHHVERQGYSIVEIPIFYRKRIGKKKLRIKDGIIILKRILTENFY